VRDLVPDRPPPEQTVSPTTSPDALRYPLTYVQEPPATPVPAQSPVPPPAQQVQAPPPQTPPGRPPSSSVQPPPRPGVIQAPQVIIQQPPPPAPAQAAPGARAMAPPAPPPHRWFTSGQAQPTPTLEPPLKDDPQAAGQPSKLFQPAAWERPKDPYKVLYWHQRVQGQLAQDLRSDIPGVFLIKTTEPVMDPWGHGHTIIPLDTYWLGKQEGQAAVGQEVIPATILAANFPDGSSFAWDQGQVGSTTGANGIPANVDNHWFKLFLGVGLQALLNYSVRAPQPLGVGQVQQPGGPQDLAQDLTRGANQAGQQLLQRFNVRPTLSQDFAY